MDAIAPWRLDTLQNVGHCLSETAKRMPDAIAVAAVTSQKGPLRYRQVTFAELESHSNWIAQQLVDRGVQKGTRLALMIPPWHRLRCPRVRAV